LSQFLCGFGSSHRGAVAQTQRGGATDRSKLKALVRSSLQDHGALPAVSPPCHAFLSMHCCQLQSPSSRRLWMLKRSPMSGSSRSILVSLLCPLGLFGTDCISIFACLPMHSQSISCGPQPSSRSAARSWSWPGVVAVTRTRSGSG